MGKEVLDLSGNVMNCFCAFCDYTKTLSRPIISALFSPSVMGFWGLRPRPGLNLWTFIPRPLICEPLEKKSCSADASSRWRDGWASGCRACIAFTVAWRCCVISGKCKHEATSSTISSWILWSRVDMSLCGRTDDLGRDDTVSKSQCVKGDWSWKSRQISHFLIAIKFRRWRWGGK